MLVLLILAVVWAAVLLPPFIRNRRDARPDNSVVSFRAQLSTLERATPGTSLRTDAVERSARPGHATSVRRGPSSEVKRRRRDVLVGLIGATGFSLLLFLAMGGALFTFLFVASASALGAYAYALRQIHVRTMERLAKVRPLVPRRAEVGAPMLMRQTASN